MEKQLNAKGNNYFDITKNAKEYNQKAWLDSDDILMYGVPTDSGMEIMTMHDAMAFISSNDASSMIALKLPQSVVNLLEDPEHCENYGIEIKDEYFVDYMGKNLI